MTTRETVVELGSSYHCFVIGGVAQPSGASLPDNTLVSPPDVYPDLGPQILVQTGSQYGPFAVTLRVSDTDEGPADPEWQDVLELGVECEDRIAIAELVDGPMGGLDLTPGSYRLRISARGRTESAARDNEWPDDDADEDVDELALEHYLVQLWPAPASQAALVRQDSTYARDLIDPPEPDYPAEQPAGLAAAWSVLRDLRGEPGARTLSGDLGEVVYQLEVPGTPVRMYNRVGYAFGWPPCQGGRGGGDLVVGAESLMDATLPEFEGRYQQYGDIVTKILEADKPRRIVKSWNWALPDPDGYARGLRLLPADSTARITFTKISGRGEDPRTRIRVHHTDVPVEWVGDLRALWAWHVALVSTR